MSQFVIRADASIEIGTGHITRCLTLANALVKEGHNCHFICRNHPGDLGKAIRGSGFSLSLLETASEAGVEDCELAHAAWLGCGQEQDALQVLDEIESLGIAVIDCLIVDHYALDCTWENLLRDRVKRVMVIDDLFDRKHHCDILLNQNLGSSEEKYKNLVPPHCQLLTGTSFAILRPEFTRFRSQSLKNKTHNGVRQLLISMGGVDADNYTGGIVEKLQYCDCKPLDKITIVLGETAPHRESVEKLTACLPFKVEIKVGVSNMAEIMTNSDLAFGAAGSSSWERCCLGLPTLLMVTADNQIQSAELLEQNNAVIRTDINVATKSFCASFSRLLNDAELYTTMSAASALLCDGRGTERLVERILKD